jgi:DNA (cytosine-5)-methyltransferase 1
VYAVTASAYYNEIDPFAAQWLRNLITAGQIPDGEVDERDIRDIAPDDLRGYRQCHFFAGIGGWAYALRLAGWPDDREVWTGSCPCQPFSVAGKGEGISDERHLWPAFRWLIAKRKPAIVFGEQVASKAGRLWLSGVRADLEAMGHEVGSADLCAAGVGAPNIRQRLWWVAHAAGSRGRSGLRDRGPEGQRGLLVADGGANRGLADADAPGLGAGGRRGVHREGRPGSQPAFRGEDKRLGDTAGQRPPERGDGRRAPDPQQQAAERAGPAGRFWSDATWIPCGDGKARRIEPSTFPLAHGVPARVGRLRGYGNAINPWLAAEFIAAAMECMP